MKRMWLAVELALLLGMAFAMRTAACQNQPQTAGPESSGYLSASELQRKAESALDHIQRNEVGDGIVDATSYIEWAAHAEPQRAIPVLES